MNIVIHGDVIFDGQTYLKDELNAEVDVIKKRIGALDVEKDEIVGIALSRTPKLLMTMFALLELRIPFLILDDNLPSDRIQYMLKNISVRYVICDSKIEGVAEEIQFVDLNEISYEDAAPQKKDNDVSYVLYTSGSTGVPKAVAVLRKGLENFIESVPQIIECNAEQRVLCITNSTFDIFFLETVMALSCGLTVVLARQDQCRNPRKIIKLIKDYGVDIVQMTPSTLKLVSLVDENFESFNGVKKILVGGEPFPEYYLHKLKKSGLNIYNMYGPTETTIWSTISNLTDKESVDIGNPIANTQIFLLDEEGKCVENGEIGEICIAGDGVSKGYINNIEETEKAFKTVIIGEKKIRIYKTGDYGLYDMDGLLRCYGRKDNQVKIRGHRIELDEIDNILLGDSDIKGTLTCTCLIKEGHDDSLITFIKGNGSFHMKQVIQYLSTKLPDYMIPNKFIAVEEFPYTSSGKIKRRDLISNYLKKKEME